MDDNYAKRLFYVLKEHLAVNGDYSQQIVQLKTLRDKILIEFKNEIELCENEILEEISRIDRDIKELEKYTHLLTF